MTRPPPCHRTGSLLPERGSALFLLAALLPLLFFLVTVGLDLSRYYLFREQLQQQLDTAALFASQALPDADQARKAALARLRRHGSPLSRTSATADSDTISMQLRDSFPLALAEPLGLRLLLPIELEVRAGLAPFDVLIALDTSSYLAPNVYETDRWGSGEPAAYFQSLHRTYLTADNQERRYDPGVLTEQCFNDAYSGLKRAAITLYQHFSAFRRNSIGVGFFPGGGRVMGPLAGAATPEFDLIRPVSPVGSSVAEQAEVFLDDLDAGPVGSWDCAAAAENEPVLSEFHFPSLERQVELSASLIDLQSGSYSVERLARLTAAESIWLRAVNSAQVHDTRALFQAVRNQLLGTIAPRESTRQSPQALKYALILAGDLPRAAGQRFPAPAVVEALEAQVRLLRSDLRSSGMSMKVSYIILDHNHGASLNLVQETSMLDDFFKVLGRTEAEATGAHLELRALYAASPDALTAGLVPALKQDRRRVLIIR